MHVLQIIESAYRATFEEQDDTVVWFTRAIAAAGARVDVLLLGAAANYGAPNQDSSGLAIGTWSQRHAPAMQSELDKLLQAGARITVIQEDLVERGLDADTVLAGIEVLPRKALSTRFGQYERIWKW